MAKVGRNQRCPCGSGKKAKFCCHGPVRTIDVRIMPLDMTEEAFALLQRTDLTEMEAHFDRLASLPATDLSLQMPLPGIVTSEVDQAITALHQHDKEPFGRALSQVVAAVDTVEARIGLARTVLALRDEGRIPPILAAIAVVELDREQSILLSSSVAHTISVLAGHQRTPSGLLVAAK